MINLPEIEEAIRELESKPATYNNCMKLASLYIVRDELKQREYGYSQYNNNYARRSYTYGRDHMPKEMYPYYNDMPDMYERSRGNYNYHDEDGLMIRKNRDFRDMPY